MDTDPAAVSYTHLDVYKRQESGGITEKYSCESIDDQRYARQYTICHCAILS